MIVHLANKSQFRDDNLKERGRLAHESFKGALGKSVGAGELSSWKNSLRHKDTVLEDTAIPQNPEHSHSNSSSAPLRDLCAFAVQNSSPATRRIPNGSWHPFREGADTAHSSKS